ncbi:DUF362 domain-containing protein [Gloeobacter kilaueensis]|uniref:DUF362 domain-containing protein n=1 Tax=Gloeobacter kilaueensis (strain ATCC BAA-2537 / CCAP 1431/1 / ULC 316 / JS1) TaxID=1183438 RepID=U5QR72_GLOK1|nr:DUF362 domain-containing protein [Gloeobacter kilaueensis]AGY60220.1 hypothetical protein GKIL_3974 [Gloeobacter kilaueensis JS1]
MSTVCLRRISTYDPAILAPGLVELLAPLGGIAAFVRPGDRVLLKPNLLTGARPAKACTTEPELVRQVALLVRAAGGEPFLGDSPAFGTSRGVAVANGLLPICEELGLPIVEFSSRRYRSVGQTFDHLRLGKEAMEADVLINLPKVKSHAQLTLTLAVKNLFGCVPGKLKAWWHMEAGKDSLRFGKMLVETAATLQPDLTIIDGIVGHEGNGPSGGEPRFLGLLGASSDVFALDWVFADLLGVAPEQLPVLRAALALGIGPSGFADIVIDGPPVAELRCPDWKLPQTMAPIDFGLPRVVRSTLRDLLIRLIREPLVGSTAGGRRALR